MKEQGDPRVLGESDYFESLPYADLGNQGFYEKTMASRRPRAGGVNKGDFEKEDPK